MPRIIVALERERERLEDHKFKASLSYIPKLGCMKSCIKGGKRVLNKVYS